ncbi:RT0821/Lpp0805 family surface protein [Oleisolibacter albus]|uniref:RT0821/Lpp0805 family surface protein n=1 Tax=Oleisolibacter albus TaxID=2171757 RepID=UPI000DF1A7B9|nr:RT0821/Lpp0805 family surface protein [Oleisolibacter albus]
MLRRALPLVAILTLAACASKAPEAPPPPPPAAPAEPTTITLEDSDKAAIQGALREMGTKPIDVPVGWANPATSRRGAVKVLRDGYDAQNRPCREFHSIVVQDPLFQHSTGFLCRQPDGAWEVVQVREYPIHKVPKA